MSTIPANMSRRPLSMIISQVITIFAQLTHCHHQRTRSTPLRAHVTQHVLMCVSAQRTHTPITTFRPGPHGLCPRRAFARRPPAAFRPGPHGLCPRQTLPSRACPSACHSTSRQSRPCPSACRSTSRQSPWPCPSACHTPNATMSRHHSPVIPSHRTISPLHVWGRSRPHYCSPRDHHVHRHVVPPLPSDILPHDTLPLSMIQLLSSPLNIVQLLSNTVTT